jgi:hypothetical protein
VPSVDEQVTSTGTPRKRTARLRGEDRDRMGKRAGELYLGELLSVRAVAQRLGNWSYGATYRLLKDYGVPMRGRGAQDQVQPPATFGGGKGSSAA